MRTSRVISAQQLEALQKQNIEEKLEAERRRHTSSDLIVTFLDAANRQLRMSRVRRPVGFGHCCLTCTLTTLLCLWCS